MKLTRWRCMDRCLCWSNCKAIQLRLRLLAAERSSATMQLSTSPRRLQLTAAKYTQHIVHIISVRSLFTCITHTQLYSPSKAATIKNKTKKKKRNKPLQDKSNTTGQHISILIGLIFSTQSTNDIIGYGELAQKIRYSITYAHRRQRKIKHFHASGRNFFGSSIEYFHECAYNYIFERLKVGQFQQFKFQALLCFYIATRHPCSLTL